MFKKKVDERIVELEKRVQGMSEIITDFEENVFRVTVDEYCSLITNISNSKNPISESIEVIVGNVSNFDSDEGIFEGKKMEFTLKHPRIVRA